MTPTIVACREFEFVDVDPSLLMNGTGTGFEVRRESEDRGAFTLSVRRGRVRLQAGGFLGVIPVNDRLWLRVTPRVPLSNLDHLMRVSEHAPIKIGGLRRYAEKGTIQDWLYDVYAAYLEPTVEALLERGMYRTYERRADAGTSPRGRIDFRRTMGQFSARNVAYKAEFSWFERTQDNAANRLIKLALLSLLSHYTSRARGQIKNEQRQHARKLAALLHAFEAVSNVSPRLVLSAPEVLDTSRIPDERYYYRDVVLASRYLVGARGLAFELGDSMANDALLESLLIDMKDVFERYVRKLLVRASGRDNWPLEVTTDDLAGALPLYLEQVPSQLHSLFGADVIGNLREKARKGLTANPDIVIRDIDGAPRVVCEVKYTLSKSDVPIRDELDQILTYVLTHDVDIAVLVHPKVPSREGGLQFLGVVGSAAVFDYRFDLDAKDLAIEEWRWIETIRDLAEVKAPQISRSGSSISGTRSTPIAS